MERPAPRTFDSKQSADRWLTLTEAEIIRGERSDPDAGRVSFGDYAGSWIAERAGLRPRTIEFYRYLLRRHLQPNRNTSSVNPAPIASQPPGKRAPGGISPPSDDGHRPASGIGPPVRRPASGDVDLQRQHHAE